MCPTKTRRGYSIVELCMGVALFSGLLIIIFMFFRTGTRAFQTAMQRQGVHSDALRCMEALQGELGRSNVSSVVVRSDRTRVVGSTTVRRDALTFTGVADTSNPAEPANLGADGMMFWDRYWVYYATQDQDQGHFIRLLVKPLRRLIAPTPMSFNDFSQVINDDPGSNRWLGTPPAFSDLARSVYHFAVTQLPGQPSLNVELTLREPQLLKTAGSEVRQNKWDVYQLRTTITPQNSYPLSDDR